MGGEELKNKRQAIHYLEAWIIMNEEFILISYKLLHMAHVAARICYFCSEAKFSALPTDFM